jgi:hypothetical protein
VEATEEDEQEPPYDEYGDDGGGYYDDAPPPKQNTIHNAFTAAFRRCVMENPHQPSTLSVSYRVHRMRCRIAFECIRAVLRRACQWRPVSKSGFTLWCVALRCPIGLASGAP